MHKVSAVKGIIAVVVFITVYAATVEFCESPLLEPVYQFVQACSAGDPLHNPTHPYNRKIINDSADLR